MLKCSEHGFRATADAVRRHTGAPVPGCTVQCIAVRSEKQHTGPICGFPRSVGPYTSSYLCASQPLLLCVLHS